MRKFCVTLTLMVALLLPQAALAWNNKGHKTVAAIAWMKLSPGAKTQVHKLLKLHPQYKTWVKGFPQKEETRGMVAFMNAATWPDFIKSQAFTNDKCPSVTPNTLGFKDKNMHKFWHFVDTPFSEDGTPTRPACTPNAQTRIDEFRDALGNSAVAEKIQAYDLTWLVHLVGDVHQPLHATERFTAKEKQGDAGGNAFLIDDPAANLHSFWDDLLGTDQNGFTVKNSAALKALKSVATGVMDRNPEVDPLDLKTDTWIAESFALAKTDAYSLGPDGIGDPPPKVGDAYRKQAQKDAEMRIALAGYRLAALINDKF